MHALTFALWVTLAPLYVRREWRAIKDSAERPNPRTGEPCKPERGRTNV